MAFLCDDVDILLLEPTVFGMAEFADFQRLKDVAATISGTALTLGAGSLTDAGAAAGMVLSLSTTAHAALQPVEIVAVTDATHATVSVPRARRGDAAVAPVASGSVLVGLTSFRAQIALVSDELLGLLGVLDDPTVTAEPALDEAKGLRSAAVFGTLAALFRLAGAANVNITGGKLGYYLQAYQALRRTAAARIDLDGDGVAETRRSAGVREV